jgi:methylated-DNA-[protein]-cysteine S-methyltransferase
MGFALFETALGTCGVAWSDRGLTRIQLPCPTRAETRKRLLGAGAVGEAAPAPRFVREAIQKIIRHLDGELQDLSTVRLDMTGLAPFTARVYEEALKVRPRETVSYGALAARAGSPKGTRAVGQAMAHNPFAIVVPCHRVLASGKKPGGFSAHGGLDTKAKMLAIEGVPLPGRESGSLFESAGALPFDAGRAVSEIKEADPKLGRLIDRVGPLRLKLKDTESAFAALAESIVYQQLSGKAAATIFGRVRALFPGKRGFSPRAVLAAPEESLRAAGLSANKYRALRDLAEKAEAGIVPTLAALSRLDDDAIVERLTQVRGIGRWTVEMLLIFRLGRPDVLPLDDYGVRKGFAAAFKTELPTPKELAKRGERWRPWRSVASWYLWRAAERAALGATALARGIHRKI